VASDRVAADAVEASAVPAVVAAAAAVLEVVLGVEAVAVAADPGPAPAPVVPGVAPAAVVGVERSVDADAVAALGAGEGEAVDRLDDVGARCLAAAAAVQASRVARKRLLRPTERVPSATVGSRAVAAAMARASAAMRKIPGAFPMVSDPAVRRPYVEEGRS